MNRFAAIIALLACWSATAATLPQVPEAGSRLGDLDKSSFKCRTIESLADCRREGLAADRIAEESVRTIVLFYRDGVLVRSVFTFTEQHFEELVGRLTEQLGTPESGSEGLKASMGGVFQNRYYVWKLNGRVWFVEQYFERVATSGLWVMDEVEFAALQAERESVRFRGARDL
ncbi:MAG: hypothetical protein JSU95_18575 [Betaproteobacteria bacterium]|nr:MAG: hypothetical protein JSU95_18575 [Betaproteobacteria bacterium]